jgi:hypothetical protein
VRLRVRTFYEYSRDTVGAEVIDLFNQSHLFPAPSLCELLHFRNERIAGGGTLTSAECDTIL